jgi:CheY-like chemotaxis protein
MTQQLILIVDDHDDNRFIFAAILMQRGFGVIQAVMASRASNWPGRTRRR